MDTTKPVPSIDFLCEINKYLEWTGIYNPLKTIYVTTKNSHYFALILFLFVIAHIPKFQYIKNIGSLTGRKSSEHIDGTAFVIGIVTVLRQFHRNIMYSFLEYICQYITSFIEYNLRY